MTLADIDTLITAYADASRVAHEVGFDGVEIHAAHGYLVDEFLWAATNHREDRSKALAARHAAGEFDPEALGRILLGNPDW